MSKFNVFRLEKADYKDNLFNMTTYYVYAHYTLDTNELFYIGKGCNNRHLTNSGRSTYWYNIVNKHGYKAEKLIDNLEEADAFIQEILAIKEFSPRANFTKGGEGASGRVLSQKSLNKMSAIQKKRYADNPELKKVASERMLLAHKKDPSLRIKSTAGAIKYSRTPQARDNQRQRMMEQRKSGNINSEQLSEIWKCKQKRIKRAKEYGSRPFDVYNKDGKKIGTWINKRECARELNIHVPNLRKCLSGKRKTTGGYRFQYV